MFFYSFNKLKKESHVKGGDSYRRAGQGSGVFLKPCPHFLKLTAYGEGPGAAGGVAAGDGGAVFEHAEDVLLDAVTKPLQRVEGQGFKREVLLFGHRHGGTRARCRRIRLGHLSGRLC